MIVHTFAGNYEQAVAAGRRALAAGPEICSLYKPLIASLGQLGRADEAKPYVDELMRLDPAFTVERFGRYGPFGRASDRNRYLDGLCRAGLPERS